ncbi:cadherin-like beta sandwich domain-containing protein [Geomonas sp. Red32]|uniref:cadherin-like beta sandwich domain-containing protein n=1 Tax=Geomonas sp. Red32 TaxID=2912856 RepID=UPI00202CD143|nr:cadherin-like beta sandwich domain-containing protein [Geomonas sp. Red32]MCM0084402.1 cadherin-like beta sandwich domain-containing protein [Geomonas sp. Red32]
MKTFTRLGSILIALTMLLAIWSPCYGDEPPIADIYDGITTGGVFIPGGGSNTGPDTFTYTFTATHSNTALTFLFRNDPNFFTLDNVSLKPAGGGSEMLINGNFEGGSAVGNPDQPASWALVGTQGLDAAGVLSSGTWYDGAVGGFDGIMQVMPTTVGQNYTLTFDLSNGQWSGQGITEILVYAGAVPAGYTVTPTTNAASGISATGAALNGTVSDNGANTSVSFNYGTTTGYGTNVAATTGGTILSGAGSTDVAVTLNSLTCNTTYHYQVQAANANGTTFGGDQNFTTSACATNYTVTYNGNGNSGGSAPADGSSPYLNGATVTVLGAGSLTRSGYQFAGWNTAANGSGTSRAAGATFTMGSSNVTLYAQWSALSSNANLGALAVSSGTLTPTFAAGTTSYTDAVANGVSSLTVTPSVADSTATVTVNGTSVTSGNASQPIPLSIGNNTVTIQVTAQDGSTKSYTITVNRDGIAQNISFGTAPALVVGGTGQVSATGGGSGNPVTFSSTTPAVCTVSGTTVTGVTAGSCTVAANQAGGGNYDAANQVTQSITVGKGSQTLTFSQPGAATYGGGTVDLSSYAAAGASTSPVTFSIVAGGTGSGTLSGANNKTLTITGAGTIVIQADQAADANYNAATPVQRTVTADKAAQTLTFSQPGAATYGAGTVDLSSYATPGASTSPVTFSIVSGGTGSGTLSGANNKTLTIAGAGTIVIQADQAADANYTAAAPVQKTLTVNKANQPLAFSQPAAVTYGGSADLSAYATSGGSSSPVTFSIVTGGAGSGSLSGTSNKTLAATGAGTVTIQADQAGDANYNAATPVQRTVTVNKATLTVTADAVGKSYQGTDPALTYSYAGLTNGDTAAVITGALTRAAGETVAGSPYAIGQGSLSAGGNYTISYTGANFTITKATPTITWLTPYPVPSGTTLDIRQLNATASVAGTLVYAPAAGATVSATQTLNVTFTPADSSNYNGASASVSLAVNKQTQAITFPAPPAKVLTDPSFSLSASATSGLTVSYTSSNPAVATVSGSTVTIAGAGTTTITASQAGNATYAAAADVNQPLTVGYAATAPVLTLSTLSDGSRTRNQTLNVTGSATAVNGVRSVTVNGTQVTLGAGNSFSAALGLSEGSNVITTTAVDAGGLETSDSRTIILDSTAPVIAVASPADNSALSATSATVTGSLDNPGTVQLTVNGGTPAAATMTGNSFSAAVSLAAGLNDIQITATDLAGNSSSVHRAVVSDTVNPSLSVVSPSQDVSVDASTVELQGSVSDSGTPATVSITMDGETYWPAVTSGSFQQALSLPTAKSYAITVTATDQAGNQVSVVRNVIRRGTPAVTWSSPSTIVYGTPLSGSKLNASADVAGGFSYTPAAGTVLSAGSGQSLSVTFTPADTVNYAPVTRTVTIDVSQALPSVSWPAPAPIVYGTALSPAQLNATSGVAGSFHYTPSAGTVPAGGTQTLTTVFVPTDTVNYATVTLEVSLTVQRGTPVVTWVAPAPIVYGTSLSSAQLNASANVAGTFSYSPAAGTMPAAGNAQTLTATFTPADGASFSPVTATVAIDVQKAPQAIAFQAPAGKTLGGADFQLSAASSSGLPVSFASSDSSVATVTGSTVTITGAGSCTITASQAGNGNWAPAQPVNQTLVVRYGSQPPQLTVSALPDGTITHVATLNLTGHVSSSNGIKAVLVNGAAVTVASDGTFSFAGVMSEGRNLFLTEAIDQGGLESTDTRTVTLKSTAPGVTVASPADNSSLPATSVTLTGQLDCDGTVSVTVNGGTPQLAAMDGTSFSATLNLADGVNTLLVTGTDLAGNVSTVKRTVISDTSRPALAITSPAADGTVNAASLLLAGTVSDNLGAVTVTVSVDDQLFTPPVVNGGFQQAIPLPIAKSYAITVTAADQAGNSVTTVRNVIRPKILGDLNFDGKVDIADALIALQMSVGMRTPTTAELQAGDVAPLVDGASQPDGVVDVEDAYAILKKAVGLINF